MLHDADRVPTEGTFRCSQPLMFQGRLIDGSPASSAAAGSCASTRSGRHSATSSRDFICAIKDADRLGEVALVDSSSSRIGQAGRIYYNTLLDENAAAHIAFGAGFSTRA